MLFYVAKSLCGVQAQVDNETLEVLGELVFEVGALAQLWLRNGHRIGHYSVELEGSEFFEALFYIDSASVLGPRVDVGFLELYVVLLRHGGFAMNMGMPS